MNHYACNNGDNAGCAREPTITMAYSDAATLSVERPGTASGT